MEGWDVDLPTSIEASVIVHTLAKIGWMIVYILVYAIRPLIIRPKPVGLADVINWGLVLSFDGVLLYTLGFKSLLYLLLGTVFGGGLHPIAGHLIQEHYMFVTVGLQLICCWCCLECERSAIVLTSTVMLLAYSGMLAGTVLVLQQCVTFPVSCTAVTQYCTAMQ